MPKRVNMHVMAHSRQLQVLGKSLPSTNPLQRIFLEALYMEEVDMTQAPITW